MPNDQKTCVTIVGHALSSEDGRASGRAGGRTDERASGRARARPTPRREGAGERAGGNFWVQIFGFPDIFRNFRIFRFSGFRYFRDFSNFRIFWFSDIFPEFSDFRIFRFSDILLEFSDFGIFALKNSSGVRSFPSMALKRSRAHLLNKVPTPMIPKYCSGITRVLFGCRPFAMVHAVHNQL